MLQDMDERAAHYATNEILAIWGDDFEWVNSESNFRNLDAMMEYMNSHFSDRYIFKYSTPSIYVDALKQYNVSWPTKYDDMFPYSNEGTSYWTGYFTTRPNLKQYSRRASQTLMASNLLYSRKVIDKTTSDSEVQAILDA